MRRKMVQEIRKSSKVNDDFDIDVFYNRIIIDAKSILGVLSMDLTQVLTVQCMVRARNLTVHYRSLQLLIIWQGCKPALTECHTKIVKNRDCRDDLNYETARDRWCLFFIFKGSSAMITPLSH